MKTNLSRLLTLFALITINSQALTADGSDVIEKNLDAAQKTVTTTPALASATPAIQPAACINTEKPLPESFEQKSLNAIEKGLIGLSLSDTYMNFFGGISIINGLQRIFEIRKDDKVSNFTKFCKSCLAGASIYSGLCGFSSFFTFHENFTNIAQLVVAFDIIKRPSLLKLGYNKLFGTNTYDKNTLFKNGQRICKMIETCAKFAAVAPILIKNLPIAYQLIFGNK